MHGPHAAHIGLNCWSPNININRDPRFGRNEEVPSEDPLLAGDYAAAYTEGIQCNPSIDPNTVQALVLER
jgi:beta-glucosidase-like glycosyl hydrolase